ncbi:Actin-like protein arp9 [Podospora bellae-mahoneyi]|uniref:Actin-like protein arp9 n=1 Tax=Podospora bellae-mahoneyi TaxID=2093777 RepID=A0ABR0FWQ9_9PEZI|nr:Actin-like protein arp9 [Podospora bellae-mahoneyi]
MSGSTGKWREEQVLIICPGSQTTLAQMGCNELTPPQHRFPTRMFPDPEVEGQFRPFHTYKRPKTTASVKGEGEDDFDWVEDVDSLEGAIYPIQAGHIVHMEAFLAFLEHVHQALTTTYHNTPIMLMASPQWTKADCEVISRYVFEKTKTPALCLLHSGLATQYGLKWPNMTVVDVGFEKVDVTCVYEGRVVGHNDVGPGNVRDSEKADEERKRGISGGEFFTKRLMELLKEQGFDHEMAEQLKKSPVCEVLPYAAESKELMELPTEGGSATGSNGTATSSAAPTEGPKIVTTVVGADDDLGIDGDEKVVNEEGVLDVASLVVSGQTREFLAKQEKLKAEKAKAGRKGKGQETDAAAAAKARLPNSKRTKTIFHYEELVTEDVPVAPPAAPAPSASTPAENGVSKDVEMADSGAAPASSTDDAGTKPDEPAAKTGGEQAQPAADAAAPPAAAQPPAAAPATERISRRVRRDIEVGLERFLFADRKEIDRIVTTIYHTVQGIDEMYMRPSCWENLVFVGNGARIRGLKDNIMQTLQARHLISPSSATMFTSELPSNIGTPSGTGSQTPTGSFTGQLPTSSSVNPLLQAATTAASLGVPGGPQGQIVGADGQLQTSHHFHSQTPTNIKLATLPTYLAEWTKNGFEEAMFLGAQVAARLAFCIHNLDPAGLEAQRSMSFSRVDYNELGPKGIRSHSMLI